MTYSLGSCVGVFLYDPEAQVGGLLHCMLPSSKADPLRARVKPQTFADTGVAALLEAVLELGAERDRLVAKIAGAASLLEPKGVLRIGERTHAAVREALEEGGIRVAAEDVGGCTARTVSLYVADGRTTVVAAGQENEL